VITLHGAALINSISCIFAEPNIVFHCVPKNDQVDIMLTTVTRTISHQRRQHMGIYDN
jgi:hypothetical protein